ncbi:MAG: hypothetical protein ACI30M_04105 [Muribaculaceae bacterium]
MAHIFRINKTDGNAKSTIVDWSSASRSIYDHGFVDKIQDSTTTQREITSIPSPFARIELVKEAFGKIVPDAVESYNVKQLQGKLHGNTIYHKMVSDSLDVGQIFFSYPSMQDKVEIKVWNKENSLRELLNSNSSVHHLLGETLRMYLEQDSMGDDPYNFGKMTNIYILKYVGDGQRQMHIIGATSPATLFFSTANNESDISKQICFGTDYAFDSAYASLDQRDPEYVKYLFTLKYSIPDFARDYPEVDKYLDAVYMVLSDTMKNELNEIQSNCNKTVEGRYVDSHYERLTIDVTATTQLQVEVNGQFLHCKKVNLTGNSDFEIAPTKQNCAMKPLVLPVNNSNQYENLIYYGSSFGRDFKVPYEDDRSLETRRLPGLNIQFPYLTISDFLEDKIICLPSEINGDDFFDGNFNSNNGKRDGYLLPIKPLFFDYFSAEDLKGTSPSGKSTIEIKTLASGVEVTLRIPISKGEVEYRRIYTQDVLADAKNNRGAIVVTPEDFVVGVFPPVKFRDTAEAHYRIAILSDFNLNKETSCMCHNEAQGFFTPQFVIRNVDIDNDIRSKVYFLEGQDFDAARISILTDNSSSKEKRATGVMLPKFKQRSGSETYKFAIDFGTSNTHIEYVSGDDKKMLPQPFNFSEQQPQLSYLVRKPSDVIRNHIRGEFIPEAIGDGALCHFPMRTVLCLDRCNAGIDEKETGSYVAFGNASPAFMYNKAEIGIKYNNFISNLKWSSDSDNEERVRCYIESLFLMIRNKVIQEGGSVSKTQIKWFYPISMSHRRLYLFKNLWTDAYKKYFNKDGETVAITESVAPYSFFQKTKASVTDIVTIDIGGGTTDIVVADTKGVKLVTSMRFAADAIFGNSLMSVQNGPLNGIIKQFKDEFIENLAGLNDLQKMLRNKTANNFGNSSEVASFLFSLADNEIVKECKLESKLNFNSVLKRDESQKMVFYIFFTAIMYHLAKLMKAKNLGMPVNIAFSGNGSKVISVLGSKESLEKLTSILFMHIHGGDARRINLIIDENNPKEATCKGGLFLDNEPELDDAKSVLLGDNSLALVSNETYSSIGEELYKKVEEEVINFMDLIVIKLPNPLIPNHVSLSQEFGIDEINFKRLAKESFNKNLRTYVEKGISLKLDSKDVVEADIIEETLFFYPIIGVINDLSEKICQSNISQRTQNSTSDE